LQLYIAFLRRCFVVVRDRVSFHLAYPRDLPPSQVRPDFPSKPKLDCRRPEAALASLVRLRKPETVKYRMRAAYPQNHLRNLARRNCQNSYVFLTDVDIIPSAKLADGLDIFLKNAKCKGLCAYVIPTYEVDERAHFPWNKTDLIRLAKKGLARPFHHKVFIYNQFATNFSR
jgi:N-acetyllactosaminide beta-1,3-N-acetylglucosaminyltransferase